MLMNPVSDPEFSHLDDGTFVRIMFSYRLLKQLEEKCGCINLTKEKSRACYLQRLVSPDYSQLNILSSSLDNLRNIVQKAINTKKQSDNVWGENVPVFRLCSLPPARL